MRDIRVIVVTDVRHIGHHDRIQARQDTVRVAPPRGSVTCTVHFTTWMSLTHRRLRHAVGLVAGECQRVDVFCQQLVARAVVEDTLPLVRRCGSSACRPGGRQERQVAGRVARRGNRRHRIGLPHLLNEVPQHAVAVLQNVDVGFLGVPHGVAGPHHHDDRRHQRGHHRGGDHHFEQRQAAPPAR